MRGVGRHRIHGYRTPGDSSPTPDMRQNLQLKSDQFAPESPAHSMILFLHFV
jgi:hypothetical protein